MKKTIFSSLLAVVILVTMFLINGCSDKANPLLTLDNTKALPQTTENAFSFAGQNGTTLSSTLTAEGFWKEIHTFDWTLSKSADKSTITIPAGSTGLVNYNLTTTRQEAVTNVYGVKGILSVNNGGAEPTENLQISIVIQTKSGAGQFSDYSTMVLDISGKPVLNAGETYDYKYEVTFTPVSGVTYRVESRVTITNHSGSLGTPKGPNTRWGFSLPTLATIVNIDKETNLEDLLTVPTGFTGTSTFVPQTILVPGTLSYLVSLTNNSSTTGQYLNLVNNATLTESDTKQERTSQVTVVIYTGDVVQTDKEGCSLSQGFWFAKPGILWGKTVTIGGYTYTQTEGQAIWNTSNKGGIPDTKSGFLQVAAIKLSGNTVKPTASVWNDVTIVEKALKTLGKLTSAKIPNLGNKELKAAAGRIGDWIDVHHCN